MNAIKHIVIFIFIAMHCGHVFSQKDSTKVATPQLTMPTTKKYNALSPSKAAFYSAILPGAGQIYNNRYWWQLPLTYGGMATAAYFYIDNTKSYNRYRKAYRLRKAGVKDEFTDENGNQSFSDEGLENAQRQLSKNRDLSVFSFILVYVLQIVEASVTAHLLQFDTSESLSLNPVTIPDPTFNELPKVGLTLKYTF